MASCVSCTCVRVGGESSSRPGDERSMSSATLQTKALKIVNFLECDLQLVMLVIVIVMKYHKFNYI